MGDVHKGAKELIQGAVEAADLRLRMVFPHRQIMLRSEGRVSCLNLTSRVQGGAAAVFTAVAMWFAFTSTSVFLHEMELQAKDERIAEVRLAYRSLLADVADYQKRFSGIVQDLEANHAMMLSLAGQNSQIQEELQGLQDSRQVRAEIAATRTAMQERVGSIENQMQFLAERNFSLKDDLTSMESELQAALAERNTALLESTQMRRDILVLEQKLIDLEESENTTVDRLAEQTEQYITNMESLVELAGLDVQDLMAGDSDLGAGQGGPFIEIQSDGRPAGRLTSKLQNLEIRLSYSQSLQTVIRKMPFAPPLNGYYVTSSFGKRRDPVNRRWSMHYGVDLGTAPKAQVFASSPGVVIFAGWKGNYGKMIEIDHGAGIRTRYGHLSKINVKKDQEVVFGDKIGVVGSTGRSTGRHLHYEILFRDKGLDPMQFIKAGRNVFKD